MSDGPVKNKHGKIVFRCPICTSKCINPKSNGVGLKWICKECEHEFTTGKVKAPEDIAATLFNDIFNIFN
jgi:ribosomal protein L37AE/L43A